METFKLVILLCLGASVLADVSEPGMDCNNGTCTLPQLSLRPPKLTRQGNIILLNPSKYKLINRSI